MKSVILLLFAFSSLGLNISFAQKTIFKRDIQKDLDYLDNKLKAHHLGFFEYSDSTTLYNEFKEIRNKIPDSLSLRESYLIIAQYVSLLKDLHTPTLLPKGLEKEKKPKTLPMVFREINNRVYLHYNMSTDSTIQRGIEILKINNEPIFDIVNKIEKLYGTDNGNTVSKKYYSIRAFSSYYFRLSGPKDSTLITFRPHVDSAIIERRIANLDSKTSTAILKKRYKNATRINFDFEVLDSLNHIAKLDIVSFTAKNNKLDFSQRKFARELKQRFKQIDELGIEHLIIDFRANGGGLVNNINRLNRYVALEPFNITDSMYFKPKSYFKVFPLFTIFPPLVGLMILKKMDNGNYIFRNNKNKYKSPEKKYNYKNQLYVLMDGGSYSATTFTIGLWKDQNRATFIGSRPGGADWGSFAGKWTTETLPNSKVRVKIPLFKIVHNHENKINCDFFVEPDYAVETSMKDFRARADSQKEFTMKLIKGLKK